MMKQSIIFFFFMLPITILTAQSEAGCDQLAIQFRGLVDAGDSDQLLFEVSNGVDSKELYAYPGLMLLDEDGNIIAKGTTQYYGIPTGFQAHTLELEADISFPFVGTLELYGNNYKKLFCDFDVEIEDADYVRLEEIRNERVKVALTSSEDDLLIDLGGNNINANELNYQISIADEYGNEVYEAKFDTSVTSVSLEVFEEEGIYTIDIWDEINQEFLPEEVFEVE